MKKLRLLLALLLAFVMLAGVMPVALAGECPSSPDGYHHWFSTYSGDWMDSCTFEGWFFDMCSYCSATKNWSYETRYYHTWGDWITVTLGTCSSPGLRKRICMSCGAEETETLYAAHSFGPWNILEEATDHSSGTREHSCTVCGFTEKRTYDPEGTLRRGNKGGAVKALQRMLIDRGYLAAGGADGDFGEGTENAVKAFQSAVGLTADGIAWPQTIRLLEPEASPPSPSGEACTISMAATGAGELEQALSFCQLHAAMNTGAASLPVQNRKVLWSSALDLEYVTLLGQVGSEAVIQQEREAFQAWLTAYEELLKAQYPNDAEYVETVLTDQMMRHCAILCWLSHPDAPAPEAAVPVSAASSNAPECCKREKVIQEKGVISRIHLCGTHNTMAIVTSSMPPEQALMLWRISENNLIEGLTGNDDGDLQGMVRKSLLSTEQDSFASWLDSLEQLVRFFRPDEPETAARMVTDVLILHIVDRCSMNAH